MDFHDHNLILFVLNYDKNKLLNKKDFISVSLGEISVLFS